MFFPLCASLAIFIESEDFKVLWFANCKMSKLHFDIKYKATRYYMGKEPSTPIKDLKCFFADIKDIQFFKPNILNKPGLYIYIYIYGLF